MKSKMSVRYTLEAIESVRSRAKAAIANGQKLEADKLMGDLYALEFCLVGEVTRFLQDIEEAEKIENEVTVLDIKRVA